MNDIHNNQPVFLRDLALIGDRKTCAYLDKTGKFLWYCPGRFDQPSLFAGLLDPEKGGSWHIETDDLKFVKRWYESESAVLTTQYQYQGKMMKLQDWMPMGTKFSGICRRISSAPVALKIVLEPRPDYALTVPEFSIIDGRVSINKKWFFYSSHQLHLEKQSLVCHVPEEEEAWFVLTDTDFTCTLSEIEISLKNTLQCWEKLNESLHYQGPYQKEVNFSLRMLRLMSFSENGGVIAAGTTSLPELIGGNRNYDYRFVWLRDAAMITSALTRAGSDGVEERKFLSFICSGMQTADEPTIPFFTLDHNPAPGEQFLDHLAGYAGSRPVRIGNDANNQLQLDAISNVLLAAKLIYNNFDTKEHWETVSRLADYLVNHWKEPDFGMWEETQQKQYTSSKVVAAVSLEFIAGHSEVEEQKLRWTSAAREIRKYVEEECITPEGAYAVFAGSDQVDISAALFPIWDYTKPDSTVMLKTIEVLDRDHCQNNLYRRYLVDFNAQKEGAFLAGTFWMAQYWIMRENWDKFKNIMDAALNFMNDVGLMPEEGDPVSGQFLGNLPQTFVHASLIGAVVDYKNKMEERN